MPGPVVNLVPHTHWDREWHTPFQTFRLRLVELVDGLLDQLEADPSYAHFLLDGQMAVVDDYLAVRPDAEDLLATVFPEQLACAENLGGRDREIPDHALVEQTLAELKFVISPDTGPFHLAVALGVPSVGLYGHTDPARVGPGRRFLELVVDAEGARRVVVSGRSSAAGSSRMGRGPTRPGRRTCGASASSSGRPMRPTSCRAATSSTARWSSTSSPAAPAISSEALTRPCRGCRGSPPGAALSPRPSSFRVARAG